MIIRNIWKNKSHVPVTNNQLQYIVINCSKYFSILMHHVLQCFLANIIVDGKSGPWTFPRTTSWLLKKIHENSKYTGGHPPLLVQSGMIIRYHQSTCHVVFCISITLLASFPLFFPSVSSGRIAPSTPCHASPRGIKAF